MARRREKTLEKEKNAFSHFPTLFSKGFFFGGGGCHYLPALCMKGLEITGRKLQPEISSIAWDCGPSLHVTKTTWLSFGFNPFPNKPWFLCVFQDKSFKNTMGKGEIARNEQFLLFPQCFLPVWRTFCHFHKILKLLSVNYFS